MITNDNAFDRSRSAHQQPHTSRRTVLTAAAWLSAAMATGGVPRTVKGQGGESSATGQTLSLPLYPYGQAMFLDPHRATNWGPHWVLLPHVWAGLMRFDQHGAVVTDLASSIEPEQEGQVWVAEIRSDATFASGNPVTADAMIRGWMRALNPQQLAPMAGFMSRVDGYDAFIAGESANLGFEARSDTTVAVRLSQPYAHFPEDLAAFVWAAMDDAALEGVPGSEVPFAAANAGIWQFVPSDDVSLIRMIPNPSTPDEIPESFSEVRWRSVSGSQSAETALSLFQDGELAIADVPSPLRALVQQDDSLAEQLQTVELSGSTMLIGMDFSQEPFDDIRVRQAVAASIDRAVWASDIQAGAFTGATSITPPVLSASANYAAPEPLPFDPELARSLLAETGLGESNQPPVTYYQPADAPESEREQAAALLEMIRVNSGLVIELDATLTEEQIQAIRSDNGGLQFDLRWWWPFTNSPSSLIDLAAPNSESMAGWFNWSPELENERAAAAAEAFASLAAEVITVMDDTARIQMYAEAEQILVDNAVYIPLGHGVQSYVQSPALIGTVQGAFTGYAPLRLSADVEFQPEAGTPTG